MIRSREDIKFNYKDLIPVFSGLIGKIALVSSFAMVWAQELNIENPHFVIANVRIELLIGSIITLIFALLYPYAAPVGTLAPLVVLIPTMSYYGVHPFVLGVLVGIIGFIFIQSGFFRKLLLIAGNVCKTSIALTFGLAGIWLSINRLYLYFIGTEAIFWVLMGILVFTYYLLYCLGKAWLVIPVSSMINLLLPFLFGNGIDIYIFNTSLKLNPEFWWNEMWDIGFGINITTILKTIPFAIFVVLLWTIDVLSLQAVKESCYNKEDKELIFDIEQSHRNACIRNIIGAIFGGSQTGALWRSYLIPLFQIKRPIQPGAILLAIMGILICMSEVSIQVLSYIPLVWSALLFGIFMPLTITSLTNLVRDKNNSNRITVIVSTALGVFINPALTWVVALGYERIKDIRNNRKT